MTIIPTNARRSISATPRELLEVPPTSIAHPWTSSLAPRWTPSRASRYMKWRTTAPSALPRPWRNRSETRRTQMTRRRMIPHVRMASWTRTKTTTPSLRRSMSIAMHGCRWTLGLVASARRTRVAMTGQSTSLRTLRRIGDHIIRGYDLGNKV